VTSREKINLDITGLKDDSLENIDSLPEPNVIAAVKSSRIWKPPWSCVAEELQT